MSTPRTDSRLLKQVVCAIQIEKGSPVVEIVNADFARDLERENARLREALQLIADIKVPRGLKPFEFARAALKGELDE